MLLDPEGDLGLLLLQLSCFFVVLVRRNTLVEPQVEKHGEAVPALIELAPKAGDGVAVELAFGLVAGLHVRQQRVQQLPPDLDRAEGDLDLIQDLGLAHEELFFRVGRVAANQIDEPPFFHVAGHRPA